MVVTGLVVKTAPEMLKEVFAAIENLNKVSITRIMNGNKILVIIDLENKDEEAAVSEEIKQIKGVISISFAYHHVES